MVISPHCHVESPLSASSLPKYIKRAVELGRTHFAVTDNGTLSGVMSAYLLAKKNKLKFCPGIEVYFKDPKCRITNSGQLSKCKYFKLTLFAPTQESFSVLSSLSSKDHYNKVQIFGESYGLWDWDDIKRAGDGGLICVGSDVNGLIEKPILLNKIDVSLEIIKKLKNIFNDRLYLCLVGNKNDRYYASFVHVKFEDGAEDLIPGNAYVRTNAARRIRASDLTLHDRHLVLESKIVNGILYQVNKKIKSSEIIKSFAPIGEDVQKRVNLEILNLSNQTNIPVLYSDYAYYAYPENKIVQDVKLHSENKREYPNRYMQSGEEAVKYLQGIGIKNPEQIIENNKKFASIFDSFEFKYKLQLPEFNGDINSHIIDVIKTEGKMRWDNPVYVSRLRRELEVLANNGVLNFLPYFLPIRDIVKFYNENGFITGPARGSAGGSLVAYLLGITHIDPIKYDLSFERFQTLERIKLLDCPDIDQDLPDRTPLVGGDGKSGYLFSRYGNKAAQISNRSTLRLKSSIKDVNRYFHKKVLPEIELLTKALPNPPQGVDDYDFVFGYEDSDGNYQPGLIEYNKDLQNYAQKFPEEWKIVQSCLGVSRQLGRHASAFVIADRAIAEIAPTFDKIYTQWEMKGVQAAGLIKYDFLVVSQLNDIQLCLKLINKRYNVSLPAGWFKHGDKELFIWNLPEEEEVFKSIWDGDTATIFQLHTQSMVPFVKKIKPNNINDISTILALVRPGPLDYVDEKTGRNMAEEYIERRFGRSSGDIPEMMKLLPETYGVQVYQEQTTKVAREIGKMSAEDAEKLRRLFSKKQKVEANKMKPIFMAGAIETVGQEKAEQIWAQMETSSRYSFNKSHSTAYAFIAYACMFLRHYYPLEWWTAVLSNASEEEITTQLFKYVKDLYAPPDVNLSEDRMVIDYKNHKIRAKLTVLKGVGELQAEPIIKNRPYKDIKDFVAKEVAGPALTKRLIHAGVMDSLFPPKSTLIQKMQAYEDARKEVEYERKIAEGKNPRKLDKGRIDPLYIGMHPIRDFCERKKILPTMPSNLTELVARYSEYAYEGTVQSPLVTNSKNRTFRMLTGEQFVKVDALSPDSVFEFAIAAFIIKVEEFNYSKGTKKALKLHIDCDGFISEQVLWPNFTTGELKYPPELKKGCVAILFMRKREGKPGCTINEILVEKKSLT